jgi:hypothetical protein
MESIFGRNDYRGSGGRKVLANLSEDMNCGQRYFGIEVTDPFV